MIAMRHAKMIAFVLPCLLLSGVSRASDWPQYRGPEHDGVSTESVNLKFAAGGPKAVWKVPTEKGFSSFAVGGGKAYTLIGKMVNGAPREVCEALDAKTGKELWANDLDVMKYEGGGDAGTPDNGGGDGPRSTPTFSDGMVYAFSQGLNLYCFNADTGKLVWGVDLKKDHAGRNIMWKNAASPLVDGDLVFVAGGGPGQSLMAFDKKTGKVAWKEFDEMMTHSTPVAATILGERQVIFFLQSGLLAVSPKDGKQLWRFPFRYSTSTAISPVVSGDIVYCAAGYGVGSGACKITKEGSAFKATQLWKLAGNQPVANHWSTPVAKDGYLYGMFSFKQYGGGPMKCVEIATGKVMWEQAGFGAGQVILVGDEVLALADNGDLVTVEASPKGYKEVARTKAVSGKCWSTPALADGKIYVRSTKEGACYDVAMK